MGLLSVGKPLLWDEIEKYADHIRLHGIKQFINLYNNMKNRNDPDFKWGDEIEYMIVKFDHKNRKVRLSLKSHEILEIMDKREKENPGNRPVLWTPEWGAYMIESTPGKPFGSSGSGSDSPLAHLKEVEPNMKCRREDIKGLLDEDEALLCITSFPRLGTDDSTVPYYKPDPKNSALKSQFVADEVGYPLSVHPRYVICGINSRLRRNGGRKVAINVPIFRDTQTPDPFFEVFGDEESDSAAKIDHIYMDSMVFGMGCSCLQLTMQATNLDEAKHIYDQLAPMTPIGLVLSAASCIHRGYLIDRDCRWNVLTECMDDRTREELGEEPLNKNKFRIKKSRYDSIDSYLSEANDKYNDIHSPYVKEYYQQMVSGGVESLVAKHIAHLFIKDPVVVYREKLEQNDETETDHFENIQTTNWQTLRFKPPPLNSDIGWRVEFRPFELQMTDFENAAYVVFIVLLTRAILAFNLNLLIPISKVDENMVEAPKRDAIRRSKFWFRKHILTPDSPPEATEFFESNGCPSDDSCVLMTINEIINGKGTQFPGLVPLIRCYLSSIELDVDTENIVQQYLSLIANRASGALKTTAKWIRDFVSQHKDYKQDSVVNETITYDLIVTYNRIQSGELKVNELVGDYYPKKG